MKNLSKTILIVICLLCTAYYGSPNAAWGTSVVGNSGNCTVNNPGSGAIAIRGTIAVDITSGLGSHSQDLDVIARMDRSTQEEFIRLHIPSGYVDLSGLGSNEAVACVLLDNGLADQIRQRFFLGTRQIVITNNSISNTQNAYIPDPSQPGNVIVNPDLLISDSSGHAIWIGDITFWVLK